MESVWFGGSLFDIFWCFMLLLMWKKSIFIFWFLVGGDFFVILIMLEIYWMCFFIVLCVDLVMCCCIFILFLCWFFLFIVCFVMMLDVGRNMVYFGISIVRWYFIRLFFMFFDESCGWLYLYVVFVYLLKFILC